MAVALFANNWSGFIIIMSKTVSTMASDRREFTFDRVVRIIGAIILVAIGVWLINILKDVLLPFCVACLVAYLLDPIVEFTQRVLHLKGRVIATFVTLLGVGVVIGLLCYFFVPSAISEISALEKMVDEGSASIHTAASFLPAEVQEYLHRTISTENLSKLLSVSRLEAIVNGSSSVLSTVLDFLMHTLEWLMTFIYVIFILIDYNQLMRGFRYLVPPKMRPVAFRVADDIKTSMNRYFRSQALIAMCAAVFYCIGFSIVGLPLAILMGITVGILYMIPYFQYITLIPVVVLCYISSLAGVGSFWSMLGQCALVYVVSQSVCDYILTPKIMGKALGLNPAIILLSLSVWGTLMGILGMIIALPLTTLLIAYYEEYVIKGYRGVPKSVT